MQVFDFTVDHVEQAEQIVVQNYNEERGFVPALPPIGSVPDLSPFANNNLGVAAFDGDNMIGFLCVVKPFKNAFRSTDAVGVFSPMGANGAIGENRAGIYARMYQVAGEKWARTGASSHAICLYAHDTIVQNQFFRYGFGLRCIDAIRGIEDIIAPLCEEYDFEELAHDEYPQILSLIHMLDAHMASSPIFILRPSDTLESLNEVVTRSRPIILVAKSNGRIVAYLRAERDGETFICDAPGYLHVMGAYCLPEHRGKGLHQKLLSLMMQKLKTHEYNRLGVDFESINPMAYAFWRKYFDAYTHSVVRRIDEHAVSNATTY